MYLLKCLLLYCVFLTTTSQKTLLLRNKNPYFLRYLDFPKGSTFIATGSFIKRLLFTQDGGYYAVLGEMDVPWTLPTYTKTDEEKSRFLRLHRREINTNAMDLLTHFITDIHTYRLGLDESCLESIFCEMDQYEFPNNMQFTKHLLKAIATYFEEHGLRKGDCEIALESCGVALLPSILNDAF